MDTVLISFRKLREADMPLVHKWRNAPHVSKWWGISQRHPSLEDIKKKYLPRITGTEPVACYVIMIDGVPGGMMQSYLLDDFSSEKADYKAQNRTAGIDIFIGEKQYVYKGYGGGIIRQFLHEVVFKEYDVDRCIIDPNPRNERAIRAYTKAGFKYIETVWNRHEKVEAYLMAIDRNAVEPVARVS